MTMIRNEESVNLVDLVESDIFNHIQKFLKLKDLFNLRCVNLLFKNYIDLELKKVKILSIPNAHASMRNAFPVFLEHYKQLKEINLSKNKWIDDQLLTPLLANNHSTLVTLNLNGCVNIINAACIQPVIISCKKLRSLSLQRCSWLTLGSIEALSFHQDSLTSLDLAHCETISERCLAVLFSKFSFIEILNISHMRWINDNTLKSIAFLLKHLKMLNISNCPMVTDEGIRVLSSSCVKLETISVSGCTKITERSLTLLKSRNINVDKPQSIMIRNLYIPPIQPHVNIFRNLINHR